MRWLFLSRGSFLLPFLVPFGWMLYSMAQRPKICPDCGKPLSFFQSPLTKTWRQWVEGGYTCQNCSCETDMAGRKVAAGTPPKPRSLVVGISLLTLTAIPGIVLLTLLLRR